MNERIKELAKEHIVYERFTQCGESIDEVYYEFYPEELQEFAELIIRECASVFEGVYTDQQRPERIDTRIKKHFGVE
jgi:hypothetical protein